MRGNRVSALLLILAGANVAAWAWAFYLFGKQPVLLGTAVLAYSLGLRHAVDADHIAAIDNVTRKLVHAGKRPVSVGLFFAMGHSAVVVIAAAAFAGTTTALAVQSEGLRSIGGTVGTLVSALFLFALAAMNFLILRGVWQTFRHVQRGGAYVDGDLDLLLSKRGIMARLFRPLFSLVTRTWHMFPLGFLFGLGFETATEVSLLGLSAAAAQRTGSIGVVLVFPALFAAGMMLIDSTDGLLMLSAYDWAFVKPVRKLYYNLTITSISIAVAVLIGGIEALGLIEDRIRGAGWFWSAVERLNGDFNSLGFVVIAVFIIAWAGSVLFYQLSGLDSKTDSTLPHNYRTRRTPI